MWVYGSKDASDDLAFRISVVDPVTLTINIRGDGGGTVTSPSTAGPCVDTGAGNAACPYEFARFAQVTLNAAPKPGATFIGWMGPDGFYSNQSSITVTLESSEAYTAYFTNSPYTLTLATIGSGGGTTSKTPDWPLYIQGQSVTLNAAPAVGSAFAGWTGPGGFTSDQAQITAVVSGNATYTASFTAIPYTLTVNTAGAGSGTVTKTPDKMTYLYNDSVTLKAAPAAGSAFAGWSGPNGFSSTDAEIVVKVTADATYTATFTQIPYTLTLTTAGAGSGTVTKTLNQATYLYNDSVTLKATADPGSTFAGWSGPNGFTSVDGEVTVKVTADATYTATFTQIPYTLSLATAGAGSGTVSKTPEQATYLYNDSVTLKAAPVPGSAFAGWTGPGGFTSPDAEIVVKVTDAATYTATFTQIPYTLTLAAAGAGSGTVTKTPDKTTYVYNDSVTLKATADSGSTFEGWAGPNGFSSTDAEITVLVTADATYTATFTQIPYTLTLATAGNGRGVTTKTPSQATYFYNDSVALQAIPAEDSVFTGWSGPNGFTSGDSYITVKVTADATYTATFTAVPFYKLTLANAGTGGGAVTRTPDKTAYIYNESVTLKAAPATGSTFAGWAGPNGFTSPDAEILVKVTADAAYTATFNLTPYTVTIQPLGAGTGAVTSQPAGINCSATGASGCSAAFPYGTQVTLSAAAGQDATFTGWGAAGCGNGAAGNSAACTITIDQDLTFAPRFAANADLAAQSGFTLTFSHELTLVVTFSNHGPSDAVDVPVTVSLPYGVNGWTWTCATAGGATCPASGSADTQISTPVDLPAQGSVTFTVNGVLAMWKEWSSTAEVSAPVTVFETNASNNRAAAGKFLLLLPFLKQ